MTMDTKVDLRRRLAQVEEMDRWEKDNPEAVKAIFERGKEQGWQDGWQSACAWLGSFALHCADLNRSTPPEPMGLSLEKIAAFLEKHSERASA